MTCRGDAAAATPAAAATRGPRSTCRGNAAAAMRSPRTRATPACKNQPKRTSRRRRVLSLRNIHVPGRGVAATWLRGRSTSPAVSRWRFRRRRRYGAAPLLRVRPEEATPLLHDGAAGAIMRDARVRRAAARVQRRIAAPRRPAQQRERVADRVRAFAQIHDLRQRGPRADALDVWREARVFDSARGRVPDVRNPRVRSGSL